VQCAGRYRYNIVEGAESEEAGMIGRENGKWDSAKKSGRFIEENTGKICNECKDTLEDDHSCKHLHFDDFNREDNMLNNVTCIDARFVDDDSSTDFT
jgi:hypothetical protein